MMKTVPFKTVAYPQLKKALQSSGMTPPELSKKLGVSPLCVWRWTTGKNEFSIRVIKAILAVTELTFEEAFGEVRA
jgi:transcriptional regulator with XRE-family HTH domain